MHYDLVEVFQFLPNENIKASKLRRGDIVFVHQRWQLIIKTKANSPRYNNGLNLEIQGLGNGTSYLEPDCDVKIISRQHLDYGGLLHFINAYEAEQKKLEKQRREEELEEIEREKEHLRARLKDLEDE